jgi:hypothetical protein
MARQHGPGARKKQAISERMNNWYGQLAGSVDGIVQCHTSFTKMAGEPGF